MKKTKTKKTRTSLLAPRLAQAFEEYDSFHRNPMNKITHYFGITMIVIGLLGLLGQIIIGPDELTGTEYFRFDGGILLIGFAWLVYLYLDWKIAVPFLFVILGLYFLGLALPTPVNITFFIVGWILQAVGHYVFEKKSPAFFRNATHLLIGPLWIFARLIHYR